MQRQTCLSHPTDPGQGHHPDFVEGGHRTRQLAVAPNERAHLQRQVPRERVQRHELGEDAGQRRMRDLEHVHRTREVAQAMFPKVD